MDVQPRKRRRRDAGDVPQHFSRFPSEKKKPLKGGSSVQGAKAHRDYSTPQANRKRRKPVDEEIHSDSASEVESVQSANSASDEGEGNTDEARLRIAKQYLKQFSAAACGRRRDEAAAGEKGAAGPLDADTALNSTGDESGTDEDPEGDASTDDELFLDADTKAAVAEQLKRKAGEKKLSSRAVASVASGLRFGSSTFFKGHKLPVTCVALPRGGGRCEHAYTGGKDCCVISWDLETGSKEVFQGQRNCFGNAAGSAAKLQGHFRPVLGVCVAADERVFFSAGADHTVRAWDPRASNLNCVFELRGHRGAVTGVRFNGSSSPGEDGDTQLITCSADKSLKTWSVSCRSIINHFYGHASEVNCMDLLQADKAITGGSDGTLRSWKLAQDTHAAFPPLGSCVDSVAMLSPSVFCCGTQGGLLTLFSSSLKKPLACVRVTPRSGFLPAATATSAAEKAAAALRATGIATSVSALCAIPLTDALLVGTEGGSTQLWAASQNERKAGGVTVVAIPSASLNVGGAVNGLCVSNDHSFAVAAVSTESRLGRWYKCADAKNGIRVISLMRE
ncbi:hypothetical protein Efla_004151 [Eimeria flavescens]